LEDLDLSSLFSIPVFLTWGDLKQDKKVFYLQGADKYWAYKFSSSALDKISFITI
jgi:hypothetical protein